MTDTTSNGSLPDNHLPGASGLFPIRTVAKLTGINPITLRAWERRHDLIRPTRTPSGHRLYSADDIALIRRIRSLSEQGMGFSQIGITLKRETRLTERMTQPASHGTERTARTRQGKTPLAPTRPVDALRTMPRATRSASTASDAGSWHTHIQQAARALDPEALIRIERQILLWHAPEDMVRLFLISGLHRLEQQPSWPDQRLVLHWLSGQIQHRIEGLLRVPDHSDRPTVAVDTLDPRGIYRAIEFELMLALSTPIQVRLLPSNLPETERTRLVERWGNLHWIRFHRAEHPSHLPRSPAASPRVHPCLLVEEEKPIEMTETGLCLGSTNHCLAYFKERLLTAWRLLST